MTSTATPGLTGPVASDQSPFVRVQDGRFVCDGRRGSFVGANVWYAAYLGMAGAQGNRERLMRELDRLADLGVQNLRILASSERSPLKAAIRPAFRDRGDSYSEDLLVGLDFALAEMRARGQKAVLYLTNFWEWSGGMMTYLYYTNGGQFIDMDDPSQPWPRFPDFAAQFYAQVEAVKLYHHYVRALVGRTNSVTLVPYASDPSIFAWQLANEPRPGVSPHVAERHIEPYVAWIRETARLIKTLDPNHMVSTGSEGVAGSAERVDYFLRAHQCPEIDYLTAHIWPQNWGWIRPDDLAGTFSTAERRARDYLEQHIDLARSLDRPLVIEEFGFPRDEGQFSPAGTTHFRDRFYQILLDRLREQVGSNGPLQGVNFWAFGGEGRAAHLDFKMRQGDKSYLGDPSHEPQGWYSVFDTDVSTLGLLRKCASELERLCG